PTVKDLASRDVVSRAIYLEVRDGNGIDGGDYVYLDVRPDVVNHYFEEDDIRNPDGSPRRITAHTIESKLPDITDMCRTYLGVDPVTQPIPIQPTAHYAMGGIPTDMHGQVVIDAENTPVPGFYAAGECACVSIHGANRLGTNSLVDILVFGKEAGIHAAEYAASADWPALPKDADAPIRAELQAMVECSGQENGGQLRKEMRDLMMADVGVFRTAERLAHAAKTLREMRARAQNTCIMDKGKRWNTELMEAWELRGMLDLALVTTEAAIARHESRGGHAREDYPDRDDVAWLRHSLACLEPDETVTLAYKPVTLGLYEPKPRVY
ncbi:MAG TPA: FAD-binding protein, partial [Anaerolineae bacterium]